MTKVSRYARKGFWARLWRRRRPRPQKATGKALVVVERIYIEADPGPWLALFPFAAIAVGYARILGWM